MLECVYVCVCVCTCVCVCVCAHAGMHACTKQLLYVKGDVTCDHVIYRPFRIPIHKCYGGISESLQRNGILKIVQF